MAVVQKSYTEDHQPAVSGMVANPATCDVDSRRIEGTGKIEFGTAVQQGASWDQVKRGAAANKFVGIAIIDSTLQPVQDDMFVRGDVASIMWRGDVWVKVETAVGVGENVVADQESGRLSTLENNKLETVDVTAGGSGYTSAPTVAFSGGWWIGSSGDGSRRRRRGRPRRRHERRLRLYQRSDGSILGRWWIGSDGDGNHTGRRHNISRSIHDRSSGGRRGSRSSRWQFAYELI